MPLVSILQKQAIYSGRVQGVGFRMTVERLASGLRVAGDVRNLPTGQVELVIEGEPAAVDDLLARVANRMARYIQNVEVTERPPEGLSQFRVRY